jgi:uncharacterized protein
MILYCDSSALVKRYVQEPGSLETRKVIASADIVGIAQIGCVEVVAAFSKAVRRKVISEVKARKCRSDFVRDRGALVIIVANEDVFVQAEDLAWKCQLRGYEAVHLAAALYWRKLCDVRVAFATYERDLWVGAREHEFDCFPENLPPMLGALWE